MKVAVLSLADTRAARYAELLRDMPGVDLLVADPDGSPDDPARGRNAADRLGATYAMGWDELFTFRPDAVIVVCEDGNLRGSLVERAARAGAHVLCEYPSAADETHAEVTDIDSMVRVCEEAGVPLTFASPPCFGPAFGVVREKITEGEAVGEITTIHGAFNGPRPAGACADRGGALGTNAPQLLDMVDVVLGGVPAQQVYAQTNEVGAEPGVASAALLTVRYANGAVASLDCSWGAPDAGPSARGPVMTFIGDRASVDFTASPRLLGGFDAATARERQVTRGDDPGAVMLREFVAGVRRGSGAGPDGAAAVRTLRVIRAARESARTGRPVEVTAPQPVLP
ncbi:Gfo/Idh/MocA family protein [Streptomyces sp. NPDC057336]|uniref:Gfo/Idh/MocA family protein n=1 Tax=Streptomyces sp. NPDC057336 TaxID=3346102 RepID=UPI0036408E32